MNMKSKSIWVGVITVAHGLSPLVDGDVAGVNWEQVQLGLGIIFLRLGIAKNGSEK